MSAPTVLVPSFSKGHSRPLLMFPNFGKRKLSTNMLKLESHSTVDGVFKERRSVTSAVEVKVWKKQNPALDSMIPRKTSNIFLGFGIHRNPRDSDTAAIHGIIAWSIPHSYS